MLRARARQPHARTPPSPRSEGTERLDRSAPHAHSRWLARVTPGLRQGRGTRKAGSFAAAWVPETDVTYVLNEKRCDRKRAQKCLIQVAARAAPMRLSMMAS